MQSNPNIEKSPADDIQYYLGIDGGGTKTDFMLADKNGNILERKVIRGCNPNDVGFNETFRVLTEGIFAVTQNGSIPFENISVFAGLAGCSSVENLPKIKNFLSSFRFGKYDNHNDAQNAVSAGLGDNDGIAVIMGTGSIAYAKKRKELHRIGGYGYLFGDAGSGFAIGRDTILAALQHEDGMGKKTLIHSMVKELCRGETVLSKIDLFYEKGKREIAKYAPLAFDAYKLGDEVAEQIIKTNLAAVADMIRTGGAKLNTQNIKVALIGGLTAQADTILPLLNSLLEDDLKVYQIFICKKPPVVGALYLAGMKTEYLKSI